MSGPDGHHDLACEAQDRTLSDRCAGGSIFGGRRDQQEFFIRARQLVRQDGGVTAPRAGRGHPGWPMAAHELASAYHFSCPEPAAVR